MIRINPTAPQAQGINLALEPSDSLTLSWMLLKHLALRGFGREGNREQGEEDYAVTNRANSGNFVGSALADAFGFNVTLADDASAKADPT